MESRSEGDECLQGSSKKQPTNYGELELQLKGRLVFLRYGGGHGWADVQFITAWSLAGKLRL